MEWGWQCFEFGISFAEMVISCFFGAGLFEKKFVNMKDTAILLLYAFCGAGLLTLRENVLPVIPDFLPAVLIFSLYSCVICKAKVWLAVLWALINYVLMGVLVLTLDAFVVIASEQPLEDIYRRSDLRVIACVLTRILQMLFCELILKLRGLLPHQKRERKDGIKLIGIFIASGVILVVLWQARFHPSQNMVSYSVIFVSVVVLVFDFMVMFLDGVIAREKEEKKNLTVQNELVQMQLRNQNEIEAVYHEIRAIRHDMNGHLYAISGYLQGNECEKAQEYIRKIIGEVGRLEICQSGNSTIDSLIGSKTALARKYGIKVETDISVLESVKIRDEHLVTILANLYDNAIDACLKIEEWDRRYIRIKINIINQNLMIVFENSAIRPEQGEKGGTVWFTTKKDTLHHGFGLKNIDRTVKLYDGYCDRKWNKDMFICQIRLRNTAIGESEKSG